MTETAAARHVVTPTSFVTWSNTPTNLVSYHILVVVLRCVDKLGDESFARRFLLTAVHNSERAAAINTSQIRPYNITLT